MKSHRKVKNFVVFRTPLNHICDFKSTSDLKSCDFQNMPVYLLLELLPEDCGDEVAETISFCISFDLR